LRQLKGSGFIQYYRNTGERFEDYKPDSNLVNEYIGKIEIIKIGNINVDKNAIVNRKWSCDPQHCTFHASENFTGTCCDGGGIVSPYNEKILELYINNAVKYLSEEKANLLHQGQMTLCRYKLNEINDECIFLANEGRNRFCSLHRISEINHIPVYSVKPFDCCISPLEIIILDNEEIFITLATAETAKFVRWRNFMDCVEKPLIDSIPVYKTMEYHLRYLFGNEFYNQLVTYASC